MYRINVLHCVVLVTEGNLHVLIHIKNEKKSLPVVTSFGCLVHLKLVAKLAVQ